MSHHQNTTRSFAIDALWNGPTPGGEELVFEYLPLVRRTARKCAARYNCDSELAELISAGVEGLLSAAHEVKEHLGEQRLGFVRGRIASFMLRHVRTLDQLSRADRKQIDRLERCLRELESRLGREPESDEVALAFGASVEEIDRIRELHHEEVPIEEALISSLLDDQDHVSVGGRVGEVIDTEGKDPLAVILSAENSLLVEQALDSLPEREQDCVIWSFYDGLTLRQVGEKLGVTEARASQLRTSGMRRMRKFLRRFQ
jgi:RNA polymerase sigma factor for flagellar operon FliA